MLKFTRQGQYYETSSIGGYTVCKVGGKDGWTYEAWCGREQIAVRLKTAEEARVICVRHIEGNYVINEVMS